ncbi:hypothetical protein O6H91_21G041400 [Diphasiastrum complanatum]|uniref:Uncharacterized protein n=1 Tax=Diphasiastrum complanatum TaxID=34168 RepID=A0ACC2AL43_DIPCM|nr:hypothetical protein O6H91_21G041400 [Diphasiastrum complanatum]
MRTANIGVVAALFSLSLLSRYSSCFQAISCLVLFACCCFFYAYCFLFFAFCFFSSILPCLLSFKKSQSVFFFNKEGLWSRFSSHPQGHTRGLMQSPITFLEGGASKILNSHIFSSFSSSFCLFSIHFLPSHVPVKRQIKAHQRFMDESFAQRFICLLPTREQLLELPGI